MSPDEVEMGQMCRAGQTAQLSIIHRPLLSDQYSQLVTYDIVQSHSRSTQIDRLQLAMIRKCL